MSLTNPDGLDDTLHAQRVHRTLAGPSVPSNPLSRLIQSATAPTDAPSPQLAKARQALAQRRSRHKLAQLRSILPALHASRVGGGSR